jgi:8-oxo-dGTP pyrophosphatase MutT (NUDIX family)
VRAGCEQLPVPEALPPPRIDSIASAVLIPVFEAAGVARLVLTKRPETMPHHQGQIAFPGGKVDAMLDATPRDTALREAHEEIGLPRDAVEVVAQFPDVGTAVGVFVMTPFVGIIDPTVPLVPDPYEVDRVFDVALSELLDDGTYRSERWVMDGEERLVPFFDLEDETVWGATARVLVDFLACVTGTGDPAQAPWAWNSR